MDGGCFAARLKDLISGPPLDGLLRLAELHGYRRVADELRHNPETFGKLTGRVSLMGQPDPSQESVNRALKRVKKTVRSLDCGSFAVRSTFGC